MFGVESCPASELSSAKVVTRGRLLASLPRENRTLASSSLVAGNGLVTLLCDCDDSRVKLSRTTGARAAKEEQGGSRFLAGECLWIGLSEIGSLRGAELGVLLVLRGVLMLARIPLQMVWGSL